MQPLPSPFITHFIPFPFFVIVKNFTIIQWHKRFAKFFFDNETIKNLGTARTSVGWIVWLWRTRRCWRHRAGWATHENTSRQRNCFGNLDRLFQRLYFKDNKLLYLSTPQWNLQPLWGRHEHTNALMSGHKKTKKDMKEERLLKMFGQQSFKI